MATGDLICPHCGLWAVQHKSKRICLPQKSEDMLSIARKVVNKPSINPSEIETWADAIVDDISQHPMSDFV